MRTFPLVIGELSGEEASSESSGESSEADSSLEGSDCPSPPPQPSGRHHQREKSRLSQSVSVNSSQPSTNVRATSTRGSNKNNSSINKTSDIVNNSYRNARTTNGDLVQSRQQSVTGRCPLGVDVRDIVEESAPLSEDEDEAEERTRRGVEEQEQEEDKDVPFPKSNMFVDVDAEMFVGREKEFAELNQQLMKNKVAGVSGMGGSGKTTFVHLYAYKHKERYKNGMFFVDASNIHTLPLNFAQLAGPELLDLVRQPEENIPASIKKVANWLKVNKDYLLIFDAADHEVILDELGKQRPLDNFRYIPPREQLKGHLVITSRQPPDQLDRVKVRHPVVLDDLGKRDTCEFLCQRVRDMSQTDLEEEEMKCLDTLVTSFLPGRLPLHLEQTASFIRRRKWTFADYLTEVRQRKGRNPTGTPSHGDNRKTIDDAFTANFDAVEQESEEAAALLNLAAVCHSRNIPYALFTVGAMVLAHSEFAIEGGIENMVSYLINNSDPSLEDLEPGERGVFEEASAGGRLAMLKMLGVPDKSQLVKYKRSAEEGSFTVHEVIQQLLQERMKERGEMVPALRTLATILIYMLKSDDVSLANKRLFLAHAEKCADNMLRHGPSGDGDAQSPAQDDDSESNCEPEVPFSHLYQRLRIRTAFVFAWLGSFPTAWEMIEDLEKRMPPSGGHQLRVELLSLKARICVWQHQPAQALQHGTQGLELVRGAGPLNINNTELLLEYAFLHKSCAHALLTQYETVTNSTTQHLSTAKNAFEIIMKSSQTYCREEYAHLLMLHGLLHRNIAERCPEYQRPEYEEAKKWFTQAIVAMDATDYTIETCKVHLYLVEVSLQSKSVTEAVEDLERCRQALEVKLGSHHRYTAWVLDKMARLLVEIGRPSGGRGGIMFNHVARALQLSQESLKIQEIVYGTDCGKVQMGQTRLILGEALLLMRRYKEASDCLEVAGRLLEATPKNPAYDKVRELLRQTREAAEQNNFHYHLQAEENSTIGTDKWDEFGQTPHGDRGVVVSDWNRNVAPYGGTGSGGRKPCMHDDLACPSLEQGPSSSRTSRRKGREVAGRNSMSLGTQRQCVLPSR